MLGLFKRRFCFFKRRLTAVKGRFRFGRPRFCRFGLWFGFRSTSHVALRFFLGFFLFTRFGFRSTSHVALRFFLGFFLFTRFGFSSSTHVILWLIFFIFFFVFCWVFLLGFFYLRKIFLAVFLKITVFWIFEIRQFIHSSRHFQNNQNVIKLRQAVFKRRHVLDELHVIAVGLGLAVLFFDSIHLFFGGIRVQDFFHL